MGIASLGNWLFNFALGLYIPPGFINIRWGMFIVFGAMCVLAALQFFFTYPETANKSLEEIEEMFAPGGPKPWHTKPGESKLDMLINEAAEKRLTMADAQDTDMNAKRLGSVHSESVRAEKV